MDQVRVMIADAQELAVAGLKHILSHSNRFEIIKEANEGAELSQLIAKFDPHILVLDYVHIHNFLPENIGALSQQHPEMKLVVITNDNNPEQILNVLQANVAGFLTKACTQQEVLNAFHAVADGQKFFCNRVLDLLMEKKVKKDDFTEGSALSPREIQIIRHISEGLSTQQIADKLHLSPHTINAHRKNILKKLDANTPIELIVKALRLKIVPLQ
jgi:DNA-binding NarL/FixJ family response regulator